MMSIMRMVEAEKIETISETQDSTIKRSIKTKQDQISRSLMENLPDSTISILAI